MSTVTIREIDPRNWRPIAHTSRKFDGDGMYSLSDGRRHIMANVSWDKWMGRFDMRNVETGDFMGSMSCKAFDALVTGKYRAL